MSHAEAIAQADAATWASHFDYSNANRARWMQNDWAKALLMFRSYSQHMTWFLWRNFYQAFKGESPEVRREAGTKFLGTLGMTGLFAGALGLPLVGVMFTIANLAAAAFGDDDEPWDAETEFRNWLAQTFPSGVSDIIDRGPMNVVTGLDWQSRVSLRELWFRSPDRDLGGQETYQHVLEQALGPLGGIAASPFRAYDLIQEGYWDRAAEAITPKAIRDGLRAMRFATEGVQTKQGAPIMDPDEIGPLYLALGALGMKPDALALRQDANRAVKNYEEYIKNRRSRLMSAYAMSIATGDAEGRAAVREQIGAFNRAHPALPITPRSISTSLKARERARLQAAENHGMVINKRLAAEVEGAGAFGE
jgi:hypothetical protein